MVPGLSSSSTTTLSHTSLSSSSQDSVFDVNRYTENPVPERSGSSSEELRGDSLHKPTETENKNKMVNPEEVQRDISHDLPDWLQDFRDNLVNERSLAEPRRNPAPKDRDAASSCHELPIESRAKVEPGSGKHSVYTYFPKDPNCDICLKTKITRASCRRRANAQQRHEKLRALKMRALHLPQHVRLASNHAQVCVSLSGGIRQSLRTETSVASVIH